MALRVIYDNRGLVNSSHREDYVAPRKHLKMNLIRFFTFAAWIYLASGGLASEAQARQPLNGTAIINGCSGALFIMNGMKLTQPALVITNGHCIRYGDLVSGNDSYLPPKTSLYNFESWQLAQKTTIILHSPKGSFSASPTQLIFATMWETDIAIYRLKASYLELQQLYGLEPLYADHEPFSSGNNVVVHAGRFNRSQECAVSGRTTLLEGPYKTLNALRLSRPCDIYIGFSGSPLIRPNTRKFAGLANTHFEGNGAACSFNNPCEYDEASGETFPSEIGRSYGVPTDTLYRCYNQSRGEFDFQRTDCPFRAPLPPLSQAPFSFGGTPVHPSEPIARALVVVGNKKAHFCTGTFVSKNVILTAAHCVIPDRKGNAVGQPGDPVYPLDANGGFDPLRGPRRIVEKVVIHPNKNALDIWMPIGSDDFFPFDNPDFALLKLTEEYPAAEPTELAPPGSGRAGLRVSAAGFGLGNPLWQIPQKIDFDILARNYEAVGKDYEDLTSGGTFDFMQALKLQWSRISPYFIFARSMKPGVQTICHGDSGSPLYVVENGRVKILGAASMFIPHPTKGHPDCGQSYAGVFADVSPHHGWLQSEIKRLSARSSEL